MRPASLSLAGAGSFDTTNDVKTQTLLLIVGLTISPLNAQSLSPADREALIERLEKLRDSANARVDERFRLAISAYRNASASESSASELYLNCVEKVNFTDLRKKTADFREWKRKEAEKLAAPGLGLALRLQLSWLTLTLRAASEDPDHEALAAGAQDIIEAIARDADKLKQQRQLLTQPVTSTVFAKAYDIGEVRLQKWAMAPLPLEAVYEQILLPPLRKPDGIQSLRAAWLRRIQQEMTIQEAWSAADANGNANGNGEQRKIGTAAALRPPQYELFLAETVPALQWRMEVDLFKAGDQQASALRMLAHLEKHIAHKSAREWSDQFRQLLTPPQEAAPLRPAEQPVAP